MNYEELWDAIRDRQLDVEVTIFNGPTYGCKRGRAIQKKNPKTEKLEIQILGDFERGLFNGDFISIKTNSAIAVENQSILIQDKRKRVKIDVRKNN